MFRKFILLVTFLLGACALPWQVQPGLHSNKIENEPTFSPVEAETPIVEIGTQGKWIVTATPQEVKEPTVYILTETETPIITNGNCFFNWAYSELPEISQQVDAAIKEIQPQGKGHARAFGENCIYADGNAEFMAMETDFHVILLVDDLSDKEALGNWISKGMAALEQFPPDQTPGPMPGRVTFQIKSGTQEVYLYVWIAEYENLPVGLQGAVLYETLFPDTSGTQ